MDERDLALLRRLAEKVMGRTKLERGIGEQLVPNWWNPLLNANNTLELIAKIDKPMAINREDSPDGPWWVSFMNEGGDGHADYSSHGDTFMRAACEAAGKMTGFEG